MSETKDRRDERYRAYVAAWLDGATTILLDRSRPFEFWQVDELTARMLGVRDRLLKFDQPLKDRERVNAEVDALLDIQYGKLLKIEELDVLEHGTWSLRLRKIDNRPAQWELHRDHPNHYFATTIDRLEGDDLYRLAELLDKFRSYAKEKLVAAGLSRDAKP